MKKRTIKDGWISLEDEKPSYKDNLKDFLVYLPAMSPENRVRVKKWQCGPDGTNGEFLFEKDRITHWMRPMHVHQPKFNTCEHDCEDHNKI